MEIKVDYHFHPNLSKDNSLAKKKCLQWWNKIQKINLRCILITEHVYKHPQRAYRLMNDSCPKDFFCFPGMEYVTKEGVDIVVFSDNDSIYDIKELNTPFALNYDQLINLVLSNNLHCFITHPFTLGTTSIIKKLGEETYFRYLNKVGSVEISNGSFINLLKIIIFPFNVLFANRVSWAKRNFDLPNKYLPTKIKFLAVGSDAHIPEDIGLSALVETDKLDTASIFRSIINNKNRKIYYSVNGLNILSLYKNFFIVLQEFLIKLRIRICGK